MNLETAFIAIAGSLVAWLALHSFYWCIIRPALVAKVRLSITELENEAISSTLETCTSLRRDALRIVLTRCAKAKRNIHELSLSRILLTEIRPEVISQFNHERAVLASAPLDVQRLDSGLSMRLFIAVMVNSPLFAIVGIGVVSLKEIFGRLRKFFNAVTARTWEFTEMNGAVST